MVAPRRDSRLLSQLRVVLDRHPRQAEVVRDLMLAGGAAAGRR
jgi:hypothetical protein